MDKRVIIFLVTALILYSIIITTRFDGFRSSVSFDSSLLHASKTSSAISLRIAIIGSSGYIGSRLFQHLQAEKNCTVVGYDRIFPKQASHQIPTRDLQRFHVVIYLGGLTGRVACQNRPLDVERENVGDIRDLAKRMLRSQLLVFASTSAIAEGSGANPFHEDSIVQSQLYDSYVTSLWHRENSLRKLSQTIETVPQMVGLRFGTVIGLSSSQRTDLAHMALICQAFLGGKLRVTHPEANRGLLCMEDLVRAVTVLIKQPNKAARFDLFHLQSFSASIANIAAAIASRTGAHIHTSDHPIDKDTRGFSLSTRKFTTTFNFVFEANQEQIISQLIDDVPRMCLGRQSRLDVNSTPCVVCGSRVMHTVLDLHSQPLANDFRKENSVQCKRFPLRLVRCPKCYHTQLSFIVDRAYLFSHYLYQSGTSSSLKAYFQWLADKVIDESARTNGTVLEIACNDGSQLSKFSARGWKTYGVDPAKNLAQLARAQNHTVFTGFWGVDSFPHLPSPDFLDAIIAQNVFAHVEKPVDFLRACVARMSWKTKLYIQTSQCEMYDSGQFDTVYHEHVSFFTAHSFQTSANLVGLKIVNFEITPIHGRSCLVTFQRAVLSNVSFITHLQKIAVPSLAAALQKERELGMTDPWFYVKYEAQALSMRLWIVRQLDTFHSLGHTIVAYGAAAKGMVLLHYLLEIPNRSWNIAYVVDDAPLKQNTYCPGTTIPVRPTSELSKHNETKPLIILVFAWNFWDEISKKIRQQTVDKNISKVFVILPFPQQRLISLEPKTNTTLTQNSYLPLPWPVVFRSSRRSVVLISHFFNEELLLPYWIRHHAPMFDMAILIDYNSTDKSLEIIRREAPQSWKVVTSRNPHFQAQQVDAEVKDYEKSCPKAWKIALNTPEFLVHFNLREMLAETERTGDVMALRFRSVMMSGNDSVPLERFTLLLKQRSVYLANPSAPHEQHGITSYSRYIHRHTYAEYSDGRHDIGGDWKWAPIGFIAKYQFTPWPEIIKRKLQVGTRIPQSDFAAGRGTQHNTNTAALQQHKQDVQLMPQFDFRNFNPISDELAMMHRLWRELIEQ